VRLRARYCFGDQFKLKRLGRGRQTVVYAICDSEES
jgi:hypothetical protein